MKVFKEEQRFTQTWLIIVLSISVLVPIGIILNEFTKEDANMSPNEASLIIFLMITCILPVFFFKLKTRIDEKGIHYQFLPFHFSSRTILWVDISKVYVRTYDPIGEFGGWGLKGGFPFYKKNGKAINVSGNIGIQLVLKNEKKLLIGTQKKSDVERVLKTYINKTQNNV